MSILKPSLTAAVTGLGLAVLLGAANPAEARGFVSVGIGLPIVAPPIYAPVYAPPPVYVAPAYYPTPVYAVPPPVVVYRSPYYWHRRHW